MRIENALDPAIAACKKQAVRTQIYAELQHLRDSCEHWSSLKWTVRMFEVVINRTDLSLFTTRADPSNECDFDVASMNSFSNAEDNDLQAENRRINVYNPVVQSNVADTAHTESFDDYLGTFADKDAEEWFQDLLGYNFHTNRDEDHFNFG
jgi:hypothetical protein